ncbi:MFS transporter [Paracraurococcus ruber]|uniref:Aromatic acid/H+ symport family MFS transporter n=1 Tax=Paracraurococcus ruber TaxID=77675 RepID=A0ABS1CRC3_9PROT|nr:MFS transporter [Paracraurococcus ruber]MBK1656908.1 aromatic acid/H+ symport family MFS transporter [Paracraurococcus ruber]TDG33299.1 MFS transporter [Paracraurococcus ruber]
MPSPRSVDIQEIIDSQPVSRFQGLVIALCFLVVAIDGFDTAAIGFIAPALRAEWGVTPAQLAPLFAAGLFGLMVGAFVFGPLADKAGRKPVLIATTAFFGAATIASAFAPNIEWLVALRFVTGIGLGGAMPAAITLTAEFCPERRRSSLVTLMFCGFTIGSAAAGLAASHIVGAFGWHGLLVLGGVLPLLLVPALLVLLPESPRYLALRDAPADRIAAVLRRVAPAAPLEGVRFTGVRKAKGSPMLQLFQGGLATGTLLIWTTFFMSLLVFYLLSSWLPTLITTAGFSLKHASLMAATLATGGTIGAVVIGRLMDRFDPHRVLAGAYLLAGGFVVLLGGATAQPWLLVFAIFGAGFGVAGAQVGVNALAAAYYPTASRATGVSWANAVGRTGSVLGSMVGGVLLSLGWDLSTVFTVAAVPAFLAALAMLAKGFVRGPLPAAVPVAAE